MGGMAVGGDNAHARTREENSRTKQFFSHPAGDFLPTYPHWRTAFILPSAPMHQPLSAHVILANISMCHPSHIPTPRAHTHTTTSTPNSYDAIRHTCTGHGHFQPNVVSQPYITVSKSVTHSNTIYGLNIILSYM